MELKRWFQNKTTKIWLDFEHETSQKAWYLAGNEIKEFTLIVYSKDPSEESEFIELFLNIILDEEVEYDHQDFQLRYTMNERKEINSVVGSTGLEPESQADG